MLNLKKMKKKYLVLLAVLFCLANTTMARRQPAAKAIVYKLDANTSRLLWKAMKVNGGHNGFLMFFGDIVCRCQGQTTERELRNE